MYMHMCTYTHTHRASIRPVTRGWILQGPSAGMAFSQSHLFCFPMGGSARRDKHGRGVLATASSPESGGGCAEQAGFGLSAGGGAKANSAGPAGSRPAPAQATLRCWWHCQQPGSAGGPSPSPPTRPRAVSAVTPFAFLHKSNEKPEIPG